MVIVDEGFVQDAHPLTPTVYNYRVQDQAFSMYSTPPTFTWYVFSLVLDWLLDMGGLAVMGAVNARKAKKLYDYIDDEPFFFNRIEPSSRSQMNVTFECPEKVLENQFLEEATEHGFAYLRGHAVAGGIRASLYNAMPEQAVDELIEFMREFVRCRG